ncbi:MAG: AbrB family transcriptional regulator, partial [Cyanobacteria bacterium P01_H01_bin.121]
CCSLGLWLGDRLKLPAYNFLGPFLVVFGLNLVLPITLYVPSCLFVTALSVYGVSIGLKFNWRVVRPLGKAVLIESLLVLLLIGCCLGIAYEFHAITHISLVTAILGLTPGGIEAMIATVMQLGGDTGLVMAMQMSRMLLIILVAPWLTGGLAKLGARLETSTPRSPVRSAKQE